MDQVKVVKGIVKGYFFGALGFSALHIVHAFEKLGLDTGEQYATPLMIDGIAVIGLLMRNEKWSTDTRKIGLRVQMGAGTLSLAANVFAGSSLGGRIVGVLIVALFLLAEWLGDRMVSREVEENRKAAAEAIERKAAAIAKGQETRRKNAAAAARATKAPARTTKRPKHAAASKLHAV